MAALYFIRHGQASFGAADYDQLSQLGERQSIALGGGLRQRKVAFDAVVTGSMRRHIQTSQHCCAALGLTVAPLIMAEFNEYNHHEVLVAQRPEFVDDTALAQWLASTENPHKAFQQEFERAVNRWSSGEYDHEYSESWEQFRQRCESGLLQIRKLSEHYKSIAVFTSGGPIASLTGYCLGLDDTKVAELSWSVINASLTCFLSNNNKLSLRFFNDYSHLEYAQIQSMVSYR